MRTSYLRASDVAYARVEQVHENMFRWRLETCEVTNVLFGRTERARDLKRVEKEQTESARARCRQGIVTKEQLTLLFRFSSLWTRGGRKWGGDDVEFKEDVMRSN